MYFNYFQEGDIQVTKALQRVDSLYHMEAEVVANFVDFNKCQTISNLLVEKLDDSVIVSKPEFFFSAQRQDETR